MSGSSLFEVPQQVAVALTLASNATGADFDYLMKTAARESNFRPAAMARTSSASGLFQFIEGTWLRTLKEEGGKYGLHELAALIERTSSGRYHVRDRKARRKILKLRHDPNISALMAGAFTRSNSDFLAQQIGRPPTGGELYLAHFLGATDAVRMIKYAKSHPHWRADRAFPRAAKANRSIFYDRKRARGVREVYRKLVRTYRTTGTSSQPSWSTHIVKVDPAALKLRRSIAARKLEQEAATRRHSSLPLPVLKSAVLARPATATPALALASAAAPVDPIGDLLRGPLLRTPVVVATQEPTILSFNEGAFRQ